ncbi:MAG: 7TM-DISM domain-containing protein, partial [Trichodesmium sp.]
MRSLINNKLIKILLILTWFLLSLFISISHSYAQNNNSEHLGNVVVLNDKIQQYPLGLHLEIFEDQTRELTIEDVVDKPFTPSKQKIPNLGTKRSAIWVRFRVINEAKLLEKWQLILADPRMGNIDFYIPQENGQDFITKKTGRYLPFDTREVKHRYFIFHLPLKYQQKKTIYLR